MSSSSRRRSSESIKTPASSTSTRTRPQYPRHASTVHRPSIATGVQTRRDSTASVTSSIGGSLDTAPSDTQTNQWSQNAISTLLSPLIVRTGLIPHTSLPQSSAHRPPTTRDIAPVNLPPIPHVEPSAFTDYLSQVGPLFESFSRAKAASADTPDTLTSRIRAAENDDFADVFGKHVNGEPIASPSSSRQPSIFSPPPTPSSPRSVRSRRPLQGPTPLSTIPKVYFDENFHLENPRTFDVVSEFSDIIPPERPTSKDGQRATNGTPVAPAPPRKALHTNAILQEKLSWYMDTVEVHLISAISAASTSFFATLGSLKELQGEAADSIVKIKNLRAALQDMDSEMALGGLELAGLRRKRENLRRLGSAIDQLCEVVEEAKKCEELVDEGNVENATARIDNLEDLIAGRPPREEPPQQQPLERVDLRKLKALDSISDGIAQLRSRIGRGFEDRFRDALLNDLRAHVKSVPRRETLQRFAQATFRSRSDHRRHKSIAPTYLDTSEALRSTLLTTLAGLNRAGQASHAASSYREAVMREMKSMIRAQLPSSSDDDTESTTSVSTRGGRRLTQQEKSAVLARNLRALEPEAMEELLINVYTTVGEALRRLVMQTKVLLDVTVTIDTTAAEEQTTQSESQNPTVQINDAEQTSNVREEVTEALDLSSLLGQAVDIVQGQITKVLKVRREENTHLPLELFLRYFMLNRLFADECEAVSSRSGDTLKEVVNAQVKDFLHILFESQKQQIHSALESDRWDPRDFDAESDIILQRLLDSMTATPVPWTSYTELWQDRASVPQANGTTYSSRPDGRSAQADKPAVRPAYIDDHRFFLVPSAQTLLPGITSFTHLIAAIPAIAPDACHRLLDYLKTFNSRACQLILGAGATKSAGLKNINSKHLALASQACAFVVAVIPYIREFARRHLPTGSQVLAEFDKVKRLFQDHQNSIHDKLVDIMSNRSAVHIIALKELQFDDLARRGDEGPSKCVEDLCKETGTLHRVLSRHVGEMDLKMIMAPIFKNYADEWGDALEGIVVKTESGRQRYVWRTSIERERHSLTKNRILKDVQTIETRLSKLDASEQLGKALVGIVQKKKIDAASQTSTQDEKLEPNGAAMFDAEEEEATESDKKSEKLESKSGAAPKPDDKGGGAKGHQRKTTVEILGNGNI